jgi:hypothetical protein
MTNLGSAKEHQVTQVDIVLILSYDKSEEVWRKIHVFGDNGIATYYVQGLSN